MTPAAHERVTRRLAALLEDAVRLDGRYVTADEGREYLQWLLWSEGRARAIVARTGNPRVPAATE